MCAYVLLRPSHYVFTSLVLYMLLALTASLFYLGPYLGGETPASMILASFKKKKRQTEADLMHLFTDSGLFWKRVDDLKRSGLIEVRRAKYITTTKGRASIYCISLYQRVFHRSMTE